MSNTTATKPARSRHVRPPSRRAHVPARSAGGRSHGLPSPRRVLAAQVVAWHNAHPLARRIGRHQLGGYGVISLPFSPPPAEGQGAEAPARFPMFDDLSMIKGIPRHKVVALALADGWDERPGAAEWPLREVKVARGWDESQARRIHLLTVAIKRGHRRSPLRVLLGRHGLSSHGAGVVGQRLLSRPRMALVGLVLSLPLLMLGWGAQALWQGWRGARPIAPVVAEAARETGPAPAPTVMAPRTAPPPSPMNSMPQSRPAPDDILPVPGATAPRPGRGPRVGSGIPTQGQETRAEAPEQFRLIGSAQRDPQALRNQAMQLQAALQAMGQTGSRLRMDVIGTPDGDALSVGPLPGQAEAERVAKRLAAHGLVLRVTEQ
jgi:hypothetical protein